MQGCFLNHPHSIPTSKPSPTNRSAWLHTLVTPVLIEVSTTYCHNAGLLPCTCIIGIRSAKKKAMENAGKCYMTIVECYSLGSPVLVWMTTKSQRQHPAGGKLSRAPAQRKTQVAAGTTKHQVGHSSSTSSHAPEIPEPAARKRPGKCLRQARDLCLHETAPPSS